MSSASGRPPFSRRASVACRSGSSCSSTLPRRSSACRSASASRSSSPISSSVSCTMFIASSAGSCSMRSPASPPGWSISPGARTERPSRCGRAAVTRDHSWSAAPAAAAVRAIVAPEVVVTTAERKRWHAVFRLLERDERVFAVLLAVAMVGGLATLGLVPLRPRQAIDLYSLVFWFGAYKLGIFALVTATPRATRAIFLGALAIDLLLVFVLLTLTGGGDSLFYLLFFPLVAVNAYYFGPWVGLTAALIAGALYTLSAWLMPPWVGWTPAVILAALVGLPAVTLGLVAERERGARSEVERLNRELTGTLTRLQAAQEELLVAERMAPVGRLSLKVAHEVRNPISAIELNAEILQDIVGGQAASETEEAKTLVAAIRDQVKTLDALTEEYLTFARFPRPHFEEDSVNDLVRELADFVRPVATRQGLTVRVETDGDVPLMEIDRGLLRQAILNLVKNGLEALSREI